MNPRYLQIHKLLVCWPPWFPLGLTCWLLPISFKLASVQRS